MKMVNLTPHDLVLESAAHDESITLRSEGEARVTLTRRPAYHAWADQNGGMANPVAVTRVAWGEVTGLPEPSPCLRCGSSLEVHREWPDETCPAGYRPTVLLIVSRLVADAVPERWDLAVPDPVRRDEAGRPVAAQGLSMATGTDWAGSDD